MKLSMWCFELLTISKYVNLRKIQLMLHMQSSLWIENSKDINSSHCLRARITNENIAIVKCKPLTFSKGIKLIKKYNKPEC